MGLGKTLQTIVTLAQSKETKQAPSIIVCPTSLLYNWTEEFHKFNPKFKTLVIDGIPNQRKKLIETIDKYDAIITSYSLLQKDVDLYDKTVFHYAILDEAQHIKNRATRNAKSVKTLKSNFKLILSGTPIENSLDELWSLFDFLMPNFLNSYDRFLEKYVRPKNEELKKNLEYLKKKVAPFILRRMKKDVLDDLPEVSNIVYHNKLSKAQKELYNSYAASAKDELTKLVERDGFDKVQIHVLATLTRLKQICCHPAIFAKEDGEAGDSAKFDMLLELLENLIDGGHKTVIFSQYTRCSRSCDLSSMPKGLNTHTSTGSSKNRMDIVKGFNEGDNPIFLVSLKAGGTGLNLTSADTVIHYDMWWNPAVENQATDRVYRMGQKNNVSVYKLVTLDTIEEKIVAMQEKKMAWSRRSSPPTRMSSPSSHGKTCSICLRPTTKNRVGRCPKPRQRTSPFANPNLLFCYRKKEKKYRIIKECFLTAMFLKASTSHSSQHHLTNITATPEITIAPTLPLFLVIMTLLLNSHNAHNQTLIRAFCPPVHSPLKSTLFMNIMELSYLRHNYAKRGKNSSSNLVFIFQRAARGFNYYLFFLEGRW